MEKREVEVLLDAEEQEGLLGTNCICQSIAKQNITMVVGQVGMEPQVVQEVLLVQRTQLQETQAHLLLMGRTPKMDRSLGS